MIKRILCPTDFSPVAKNAIDYACQLAQVASARLTLLHVQKPQAIMAGADPVPPIEEVESLLRDECIALGEAYHIQVSCEVEPGIWDFDDWVVHRSDFFDLVVMGSNGAETVEQMLFGSHAFNVIKKTKIPVLVIPEGFEFKNISRIIYAYDYKAKKLPPLEQLQEFADIFNTKVCFLTIVDKYTPRVEDEMDQLFNSIESNWKNSHSVTFDYVYYPDVVKSLNHYYQMWSDNDLLVLAARSHSFINLNFHKSVIREVTNLASYPVLVIHE